MAVALQAGFAVDLADAALFAPTEGRFLDAIGHGHVIHADAARLHAFGNLDALAIVTGPNASAQTVGAVVGELDGFFFVGHPHDGKNGAEGFLAHDLHSVVDVGQHGGFVEKALKIRIASAAGQNSRPPTQGIGYVLLDDLELPGPEDCPHIELPVGSLAQFRDPLHDFLRERIRHRVHHVNALGATTILTGIHERAGHGPRRRVVEIDIIADDHRVLPPEFEGARNQLLGAGHGDLAPGLHASGKSHLVDPGPAERRAGFPIAGQHLQETVGQPCLGENFPGQ